MKGIRTIEDVVKRRLCIGCGACTQILGAQVAQMVDFPNAGLIPVLSRSLSNEEARRSLSVCPGLFVYKNHTKQVGGAKMQDPTVGSYLAVWNGYAADSETRFQGSSGGVLTAISQYCLEQLHVDFIAHTGMDNRYPWKNQQYDESLKRRSAEKCRVPLCTIFSLRPISEDQINSGEGGIYWEALRCRGAVSDAESTPGTIGTCCSRPILLLCRDPQLRRCP